jgi:hypothetical protein
MTIRDQENSHHRTAAVMRDTADQLEKAESALHRNAEASPSAATKGRLHRLGDRVTEAAGDIARRAERVVDRRDGSGPS